MPARVRTFAFGVLGGVLLSAMRAPLGLDLFRAGAMDGVTAALVRAAGLLGLALAIGRSRLGPRLDTPVLVLGLSAGYALHGLALDAWFPLGTRFELAVLWIATVIALHVVGRGGGAVEPPDDEPPPSAPRLLERVGLAAAGGGAAFAIECVARRVRLLGLGLPQDDTVAGITFLVAGALGAAALASLVPARRRGTGWLALGLALAALSCALASTRLIEFTAAPRLAAFLERMGSLGLAVGDPTHPLTTNISHLGTWRAAVALSGASLVLPALAVGAAAAGSAEPRRLASVLVGAAAGLVALPFVLRSMETAFTLDDLGATTVQARLVGGAMLVACGGAVAAGLGAGGAGRTPTVAGALALGVASTLVQVPDAWLLSPWDRAPVVEPFVTVETSEGLLTVEGARSTRVVTLDRKRLTPGGWEEEGDALRFRLSLELVDADSPRVLVVGQLTPARASALANLGLERVDRTAPWARHVEGLESVLFDVSHLDPPAGAVLTLAEARNRLAAGEYDLAVVTPTYGARLPSLPAQFDSAPGPAPRSSGWSAPDGTVVVVWVDGAANLGSTALRDRVLVCPVPFEEPTFGLVLGEPATEAPTFPPAPRAWGPTAATELTWRGYQRQHRARAATFARLAAAVGGEGTAIADAARFYAGHFAGERESSPFLRRGQKVEFRAEDLELLRSAALAEPPGTSLRAALEGIATLLTDRRDPHLVIEYLVPIADAHAPWPALERAGLEAFAEFDLAEEFEPRFASLVERFPHDADLWKLAAALDLRRDRPEAAETRVREALQLQPDRPDLVRLLARALEAQGSPEAARWEARADELEGVDHDH